MVREMKRPRSYVGPSMRWLLSLVVLAVPTSAFAQEVPWADDLARARRAFAAGEFAEAALAAAAADAQYVAAIDEGVPEAWQASHRTVGCLWGLSALAAGIPTDDAEARNDATDRVSAFCDARQQAVAALLLGDPLEAALRGASFPAPFRHLTLPAEARTFGDATHGDTLPIARDVTEAARFVRAHAAAHHGLDTECSQARGFDWLPRRDIPMNWTSDEVYMDEEESQLDTAPASPPAPFAGAATGLALVTCSSGPGGPPEERGFGDGRGVVVYVLSRSDTGEVRVVGSFVGFPMLDCWTGVVQANLESAAIPGTTLIRFVDREGYVTDVDGPGFVADFTTICDTERGGCRTVPTAFWRNELIFDEHDDDAEPTLAHTEWHGALVVEGSRIHLTESRTAPRPLRVLGRALPIARFLAAASVSGDERALFPDADAPAPVVSAEACPWEVADADGTTNLRAAPSGAVVGTVPTGTRVVPVERRGRWWRIEAPAGWLWAPNLRQACPPN